MLALASRYGVSTSTSRTVGSHRGGIPADETAEDFHSELEAFASHLVLENQQLQYENKQLNALLKEYEQTLETVMGKFRGVSVGLIPYLMISFADG
jgi:hypothetical protein